MSAEPTFFGPPLKVAGAAADTGLVSSSPPREGPLPPGGAFAVLPIGQRDDVDRHVHASVFPSVKITPLERRHVAVVTAVGGHDVTVVDELVVGGIDVEPAGARNEHRNHACEPSAPVSFGRPGGGPVSR